MGITQKQFLKRETAFFLHILKNGAMIGGNND